MSAKVLVVEDETSLLETMVYTLDRQGYEVITATDGFVAVELARAQKPDVVLLDIMLPSLDGFEVCRILRQEMSIPILMMTARTDEVDEIVGLEIGADDYLIKPVSMRMLLARLRAHLRRERILREKIQNRQGNLVSEEEKPLSALIFDDLMIDVERRKIVYRQEIIHLRPMEFDLLVYLGQNQGRVLSREQILTDVWGWDDSGNSRTVDVHIRWLREKIEENPSNPTRIVTVHSVGYRFEG